MPVFRNLSRLLTMHPELRRKVGFDRVSTCDQARRALNAYTEYMRADRGFATDPLAVPGGGEAPYEHGGSEN